MMYALRKGSGGITRIRRLSYEQFYANGQSRIFISNVFHRSLFSKSFIEPTHPSNYCLPCNIHAEFPFGSYELSHGNYLDSLANFGQSFRSMTTKTDSADTTAEPTKISLADDSKFFIAENNRLIQGCALQGDAIKAQQLLSQLEEKFLHANKTDQERSDANDELLECRKAVFDAWVSYQKQLFSEWEDVEDEKSRTILSNRIFQAATAAHQVLEKIIPFLSRPAMSIYTRQNKQQRKSQKHAIDDDLTESLENPSGVLGNPILSNSNDVHKSMTSQDMLHRCNEVLRAWANASQASPHRRRGIPQRATFLLQRMQASTPHGRAFDVSTNTGVQPTIDSYNSVLESWAWSPEHLRATMAEQIFQGMHNKKKQKKKQDVRPNGESYSWIIQAWCRSQQKRSALEATKHLTKYLRRLEFGKETTGPSLELYHMVMKAWAESDDKNAPIKAMSALRMMDNAFLKHFSTVAVDEACYRYYLMASSKGSIIPEQGPLADQMLNKLKGQQIVPDTICYASVIRTWKNAALNPMMSNSREKSVTRAVEVLEELAVAHNRTTERDVKPRTEHFNDVLQALSVSSRVESPEIAETLVSVMEEAIHEDLDSPLAGIRPNADTYRWLLSIHSRSRGETKVQSAKAALERMKNIIFDVLEHDNSPEESVINVYNAYLQVCTSSKVEASHTLDDANEPLILQEALQSVDELRSLYELMPNSQTYTGLLQVCAKHLPMGPERCRIAEDIFKTCCSEGMVDETVVRTFKKVASEQQYYDLVMAASETVEGIRMVPEGWTRNIATHRVVTAEGRKVMPLSVEGKYTVTKGMKEYRMRKLRSKSNRKVLQGGRLKLSQQEMARPIRLDLDEEAIAKAL